MSTIKHLVYAVRRLFHPHSFDKEVELAGMNYWPFKTHLHLRVCKCGSSKIVEAL